MEIGGLVEYAFKAFLGNPDVMAFLLSFAVFITLYLVVIEVYRYVRD